MNVVGDATGVAWSCAQMGVRAMTTRETLVRAGARGIGGVLLAFVGTAALAQNGDAPTLRLQDVVGVVEISTEPGAAFSATVADGAVRPVDIRETGNGLVIEGDDVDGASCRSRNGRTQLRMKGGEMRPIGDYARITVTAPSDAALVISGGVLDARVGDVGSADVELTGCTDIRIGDIAGPATLTLTGSGDLETGNIGGATDAALRGSGDLTVGSVAGDFGADLRGSGDIQADRVDGAVRAELRGSGDIQVDDGMAPFIEADLRGSGDIEYGGVAERADLTLRGSGDIEIAAVTGEVSRSRSGSGDISVND